MLSRMEDAALFSVGQKRQDLFLGIAFLLITAFSSVRIYRNWSPTGGRKVITMFNLLIFVASALRTIWFLVPNDWLEASYTPRPIVAFVDKYWLGTLVSEILLVAGSLSLYGIFILVACYWVNMLQKLNSNVASIPSGTSGFARFKTQHLGAIETFTIIMSVIGAFQLLSIVLFLTRVFNSEQMVLYDAIMLSVVSVAVVAEISILSIQIRRVLENLEVINNRNSQPQIRRIFAIIVVANVFFVTRVILECTLAVSLIQIMKERHSFSVILSDKYWSLYILLKHLCEVVVLTLELIISTAIKSYDSRAQPVMHTPGGARGPAGIQNTGAQGSSSAQQSVVASQPRGSGSTHAPRDRLSGQYAPITSSHPPPGGMNAPATYGATAAASNAAARANMGSGGSESRDNSGRGRYKESDYGVELATERTPMLHQYDASRNNEV